MARLPNDEWLQAAKGCAIGSSRRIRHKHERTEALTVGNTEDRWWAYCQRCKSGAVEMKSHVMLGTSAPLTSTKLTHPTDALPLRLLKAYEQQHIASFLAKKNMDMSYLTGIPVTWSPSRQRLLLDTPSGLMGRDTTERSEQKWLTYDHQHWITDRMDATLSDVLLVEDCFSWAKVSYACPHVSVFCTLGTLIHDALFLHLLQHNKRVYSFYDGDYAGWTGAQRNQTRLRGAGLTDGTNYTVMCAPQDLDPKDMSIAAIQQHVQRLLAIQ